MFNQLWLFGVQLLDIPTMITRDRASGAAAQRSNTPVVSTDTVTVQW
jgi:hypothetical protein